MNAENILRRLYVMRKKRGYAQKAIAQAVGCSVDAYGRKEKGVLPITTEEWLKIADVLDMMVGTFFIDIPIETFEESKALIHGFNRLSANKKKALKVILDTFLRAQWLEYQEKQKRTSGVKKDRTSKRSVRQAPTAIS